MAGRGRVPARGGAGGRRSQLRHPGGEARRPAARRDRARATGSRQARSRGSRVAARLRRFAAFCRNAAAGIAVGARRGNRYRPRRAGVASSRRDVAARSALRAQSQGGGGSWTMTKRLGALILLLSLAGAPAAQAQPYPTRTITLTVTA